MASPPMGPGPPPVVLSRLILRLRGGPISADMVARIVSESAEIAWIGFHVRPHMLRHGAGLTPPASPVPRGETSAQRSPRCSRAPGAVLIHAGDELTNSWGVWRR